MLNLAADKLSRRKIVAIIETVQNRGFESSGKKSFSCIKEPQSSSFIELLQIFIRDSYKTGSTN
jgi:hypothetical protein